MKKIICAVLLSALSVISPSLAASPGVTLRIEDGRLQATASFPRDVFFPAPIDGTDFRWIGVSEGAGGEYGLANGVYIFDDQGALFLSHETERCDSLALSPGGVVLALGKGSPAVRQWDFYSFPGMDPLGSISSPLPLTNLMWVEDAGVVYTTVESGDYGRTEGDEPRAPRSVAYYAFKMETERILLRGTSRYDYSAIGLEGRTVLAEKASAAGAEDLPGLPVPSLEKMSALLPALHPDDFPELVLHYDLAVEGVYLGMNEGDSIRVFVEMLPSTLGEAVDLELTVQESEHFNGLMAMPLEERIRVTYDMVQQWDARAGKRTITPVVREVRLLPNRDPKG